MSRCDQVREWLAAAVDGDLAEADRAALETHLAGCDACREVASWLPEVDGLVAATPASAAPDTAYFEDLNARVLERVAAGAPAPAPRPWWRRWPALAPAALVVTLLGVVTVRQALEDPPTAPTASRETDRIQTPPRELPRKSAPAPDEPELREEESVPEAQPAPPASGGGDPSGPDPSDADAERARSQDSSGDPGEDAPAAAKATAQAPTREAARVVLPSPDPSVPPAADAPGSAPPSLRDRFRRAQAAAGTDAEADALAALVVALETTPAPATLPLRDADDAVGKARRQFTAAPPAATTLADSVVVHLSSRLGVFIDSAQRERAQRQLRRFGRE